jgi:hypothetical protein
MISGFHQFTTSQTELIRTKTEVSFNQIQFSATIMVSTMVDRLYANSRHPSYVMSTRIRF